MVRNRTTFNKISSRNGYDFIPNYLNDIGKKLILSREKEFTSLMIIFGQIKLLQAISKKLNFSNSLELNNIKDKFFY